jgi:hypothetical protein
MGKPSVIAALVLALTPLAASAQEYAVKFKLPGLGDKSQVKATGNSEVNFKLLDDGGNAVVDARETKTKKLSFTDTGLERGKEGDELIRVKRHYDHAERRVKDVRETLPYQGKTVLIEKKDGTFQFRIEDDERLEGKDAEELHEEFNKGGVRKFITDHFLPRKLVKVNEAWTFDVAPLAKGMMADGKILVDDTKATGSGKLTKVYKKDGREFGVVELTMEFPVTQFVGDDGTKHATKDSKITVKIEADGCIAGTAEPLLLKVAFSADVRAENVNINGMNLNLVITLRATAEEQWMPAGK